MEAGPNDREEKNRADIAGDTGIRQGEVGATVVRNKEVVGHKQTVPWKCRHRWSGAVEGGAGGDKLQKTGTGGACKTALQSGRRCQHKRRVVFVIAACARGNRAARTDARSRIRSR